MAQEFRYCDNAEADIPRMFIDKEIGGKDTDGNPNIDGNAFRKELMHLSDTLGKKRIEVWINSPGGLVTEGQSIYAAILESNAIVDTVCYGMAASIAGVIFQAGHKRIMLDFANLMYHPAYNEGGTMDKGLEALNKAICTMIAKRTGKTEEEIWKIANRGRADDKGTWIQADEAKINGFCDEVRASDAKNKNILLLDNLTSIWKSANKVYNRASTPQPIKDKKMKTVLNKLGLNEEASEASALAVVETMNKNMESLQKKYDALNAEMEKCKGEMDAMKAKAKEDDEKMKAKAKEDEEAAKAKAKEDGEKEAKNAVTAAVAAGKIKNDATIVAALEKSYSENPASTKALIEAMPINKLAPSFKAASEDEIKDSKAEQHARNAGLKPGTAKWYNAVKAFQMQEGK